MDYTTLKNELLTDPLGLGYAAPLAAGAHGSIADLINLANRPAVGRQLIPSYEVVGAIDQTEFNAISAANKTYLQFVVSVAWVDISSAAIRAAFASIFGAGTTSRTNLVKLQNRVGSRAEELFGLGVRVTAEDIAVALKGG